MCNNGQWQKANSNDISPLHYFIGFDSLTVCLDSYSTATEEDSRQLNIMAQSAVLEIISNPKTNRFRLQLEFGIKILPSINSDMENSIINATNSFVKEISNDALNNKQ